MPDNNLTLENINEVLEEIKKSIQIKSLDDIICKKGYYITADGRVFNSNTNKWRKLNHNNPNNPNHKYPELIISLGYGLITKHYRVNRLVAHAFLSDYSDEKEVHHIDKNTFNNNVSNLKCLTKEEHKKIHNTYCPHCGKSLISPIGESLIT